MEGGGGGGGINREGRLLGEGGLNRVFTVGFMPPFGDI